MPDLSGLSDSDLLASIQGGGSSASDFSSISNDQLLASIDKSSPAYQSLAANGQLSAGDTARNAVRTIPSAIGNMISSIPSGLQNLYDLPGNLIDAGEDAGKLAIHRVLGTDFQPSGADYGQIDRTLKGVGSTAATVAGATVGSIIPGAGTAAGADAANFGFNKLLQAVGALPATTVPQDAASLVTGGVQNFVLGAPLETAGAVLGKTGDAVKPVEAPSVEDQQIASLGINPSAVKAAAKFKPTLDGVTPIEQAIQGATDRGVFSGEDVTPEAIQTRNNVAIDDLNAQLHGEDGVLSQADAAQKNVDIPKLDKANAFVESNPFQKEALGAQLAKRISTINDVWDGTVSGLSKVKSMIGRIAYDGTTDSKALDQALYQDLKTSVESQAESAVPGLGAKVKALNSDLSEHYTLDPIIRNAVNKGVANSFKLPASNASTISQALMAGVKGFAAGGAGGALLGISGVPHVALPAALAIGAIKGGAAALRNPLIGGLVSKVLSGVGSAADIAAVTAIAGKSANQQLASKVLSKKGTMDAPTVQTIAAIKADPTAHAIAMTESSMNPKAANPDSTAKGLFQFLDSTGKKLGITDPFDVKQQYSAYKTNTASNAKILGTSDPETLYAAHVVGPGVVEKVLKGETLTTKEAANWQYFITKALPNFQKNYQAVTANA